MGGVILILFKFAKNEYREHTPLQCVDMLLIKLSLNKTLQLNWEMDKCPSNNQGNI